MIPAPDGAQSIELVFVHVPKTGGIAVRSALEEKYGETLLRDYGDKITNPDSLFSRDRDAYVLLAARRPLTGKRAIYGHFWIGKYQGLGHARKVAILREPVARLVSNYYYWLGSSATEKHLEVNKLRNKLVKEKLTIAQFARIPVFRAFYSGCYFRDIDMSAFDFIGDHADLAQNWDKVMARLDLNSPSQLVNTTSQIVADYSSRKAEFYADAKAVEEVRRLLSDDIRFYETWAQRL